MIASRQAIKDGADDALVYSSMGHAQYELGLYEQAIGQYNKAVERAPRDPLIYQLRAHAYAQLGDWERAEADYEAAANLDQAD